MYTLQKILTWCSHDAYHSPVCGIIIHHPHSAEETGLGGLWSLVLPLNSSYL